MKETSLHIFAHLKRRCPTRLNCLKLVMIIIIIIIVTVIMTTIIIIEIIIRMPVIKEL